MTFLPTVGSAETEAFAAARRQREIERSTRPGGRQDEPRRVGLLRFASNERWSGAVDDERPGCAAHSEGEVLEGLQHLGLVHQRDPHGGVSERLLGSRLVRLRNARVHLRHILDARHLLLLGRHRSELRLVDPLRHRLHLLRLSADQRNLLGIDVHLSQPQAETNEEHHVATNAAEAASEVCAAALAG